MRRPAFSKTVQGVAASGFVALALLAACSFPERGATASQGRFSLTGTVTRVVDGDTLHVVLAGGKRERVRLIGIDAPEQGECHSAPASARARQLALSKRVTLKGDSTQATRDQYGRLLAYVWFPGGKDLGYQLLAGGFAKVYVYRVAFERLSAYRSAEATAKGANAGRWRSCLAASARQPIVALPPSTPPPGTDCHASYSPCLPIAGDLDCADVRALGVAPVRVLGSDPYRLDGDGDGLGCE